MQQLTDKGCYCALFPADAEQNSNPAPESLQSKYKAKGGTLVWKRAAHICAQTPTSAGEDTEEYKRQQP